MVENKRVFLFSSPDINRTVNSFYNRGGPCCPLAIFAAAHSLPGSPSLACLLELAKNNFVGQFQIRNSYCHPFCFFFNISKSFPNFYFQLRVECADSFWASAAPVVELMTGLWSSASIWTLSLPVRVRLEEVLKATSLPLVQF